MFIVILFVGGCCLDYYDLVCCLLLLLRFGFSSVRYLLLIVGSFGCWLIVLFGGCVLIYVLF